MADVIKAIHNRDYISISLYHLQDVSLSNRAKGLLTLLLIQPDNETCTIKYLSVLSSDSEASIKAEIKELIEAGYLCMDAAKGTLLAFETPLNQKEYTSHIKEELKKAKEIEKKQQKEKKKEPVQSIKKVPYEQYKECFSMFQNSLNYDVLIQTYDKELVDEFIKSVVLAYCAEGEVQLNRSIIVDAMVLKFKLKFMTPSEAHTILEKYKEKKNVSYPRQYLLTITWNVLNNISEEPEEKGK